MLILFAMFVQQNNYYNYCYFLLLWCMLYLKKGDFSGYFEKVPENALDPGLQNVSTKVRLRHHVHLKKHRVYTKVDFFSSRNTKLKFISRNFVTIISQINVTKFRRLSLKVKHWASGMSTCKYSNLCCLIWFWTRPRTSPQIWPIFAGALVICKLLLLSHFTLKAIRIQSIDIFILGLS
jgi:hypothetical protein